ncbi:MAG TPA: response regulator, partial [Candidatus Binatia bacterium]
HYTDGAFLACVLIWLCANSIKSSWYMAKNVLIVDDNVDLRRILAKFLQSCGYETTEARSGQEAIDTAIAAKPNLILLDLTLPDMKGTDAARALRKYPTTAHIPIIGCSAYFGTEFRQEALRSGMTDYVQKPISAAGIATVVKQLIPSES